MGVEGLIMGMKPFTNSNVIIKASIPITIMPKMQTLDIAHISLREGYLASLNTRLPLLMKETTREFLMKVTMPNF
jgi:hypothetical protein